MEIDEPKLYRTQCIGCSSFLSYPFQYDYDSKSKEDIKVDRFKGDNINYHSENEYNKKNNIFYSFIYCLKCGLKVGYWISQASKREINNINKLFFFQKNIKMIKYDKSQVTEEQHRIFKQDEVFYNSNFLTKKVVDYAKEHIDNFIQNVEKFESERKEAEYCYRSFDRKIITLKNYFIKAVKDNKNTYHLGIDFSKDEKQSQKRRNKTWNNKDDKQEVSEDRDEDEYEKKSNGKNNLNIFQDDHAEENLNGGKIKNNLSEHSGSDIYLENKNKKNRAESTNNNRKNKEPSKIRNKKNSNKNKRKRK